MTSKPYLKLIDTTTKGRYDVTPVFSDVAAFEALTQDLVQQLTSFEITKVLGIDALGFILGTAIALKLNVGFVPVRKIGKLPGASDSEHFLDYTKTRKGLELRQSILSSSDKVLIVDEWIETGAQVKATIDLARRQGAKVVAIATIGIDPSNSLQSQEAKIPMIGVWNERENKH